jgi:hypothetical protein
MIIKKIEIMIYTIKQNKHYCNWIQRFPAIINTKKIFRFETEFNENCIYQLPNNDPDNLDINKLYGYSFGLDHHIDSIRIGWNCEKNNGMISLFAYYYNKGVRCILPLLDIPPHKTFKTTIINNPQLGKFQLIVNNNLFDFKYDYNELTRYGLLLHPYFGGNEVAPHKMNIYISRL